MKKLFSQFKSKESSSDHSKDLKIYVSRKLAVLFLLILFSLLLLIAYIITVNIKILNRIALSGGPMQADLAKVCFGAAATSPDLTGIIPSPEAPPELCSPSGGGAPSEIPPVDSSPLTVLASVSEIPPVKLSSLMVVAPLLGISHVSFFPSKMMAPFLEIPFANSFSSAVIEFFPVAPPVSASPLEVIVPVPETPPVSVSPLEVTVPVSETPPVSASPLEVIAPVSETPSVSVSPLEVIVPVPETPPVSASPLEVIKPDPETPPVNSSSSLEAAFPYRSKKAKDKVNDKPSHYSFWPKRFTLRHVEGWGEGVSFGTDYSTVAMLIAPDYRVGRILPMLDLRGHRFDDNTYAANIGIAGRYIPASGTFCQILGLNLFYDWREGRLGSYQQIGVGLEVLGKRWDLRANGYAPISVKMRKSRCLFISDISDYYAIYSECEFTSYGYNAEVGYYVVRTKDFFLYAAGGPYYMVRKCHDRTRGGEFRIRPQYKDYLALDFSVSHDSVFGTVYQAQVILYLPLYQLSKKLNKRPCNLSDQQIYQPIERFEVMPVGRRSCWKYNF